MGYISKRGRRPMEYASKSAHGYVIKDPTVQSFLSECNLPKRADEISLSPQMCLPYEAVPANPIRHIIAIDGGYNEVPVRTEFPSATVCFFQFGALTFSVDDLNQLTLQPFIDPEDMAKLKRIQRIKLTLPIRNVSMKSEGTLTNSVRRAMYDFFQQKMEDGALMDTHRWFVFQEYDSGIPIWTLASCPTCRKTEIPLSRADMTKDATFLCPNCGGRILLTDVFRLHEAIDDEIGAGGILG